MSSTPPSLQALNQSLQGEPSTLTQQAPTQIRATCTHSRDGRIIVLSADGTANKFGEKSTNVVEFLSRIVKNKKQSTFYISGIGTHNPSPVGRILDMAFANSFETNILIAYKWLAENYEEGDRIFMFGFSRGAYQVRVIAGMIQRVGLIYPGNTTQLPDVYKLYMSTTDRSSGKGSKERTEGIELCETFKSAFSWPNVKVHFVGVWDTVASVGITMRDSLPETIHGMTHVCHFRHALALDEKRVKFLPEYASGSKFSNANDSRTSGDVKEVWFAGSHSDIGGGNVINRKLKTFGPALRWMTYEAMSHGLQMHPYSGKWVAPNPTRSLKAAWPVVELLPLRHPSYRNDPTLVCLVASKRTSESMSLFSCSWESTKK
ncbi:hypothetical protein PLEOSDRAFT_1082607 [Pleurotus ostreatus PC15]|uniref:T6SS Phospholipase effector Tle1-like catalytic domain-containing protein n=1 Tax=Pleurotus ostreatus (strain PC15) TaxID=1137138 RepID=A0A067NNG3_PLEO1|nr:hypothetical protein PLEOSDRAFT_1082607 [Pleurotus ostreatus PC15]